MSTFVVAGAIKPDGTGGWYVLDDTAHTPLGGLTVTSVTTTAITVSFDQAAAIHTFVVGVDDVLGKLHYSCGASVGLDTAVVFLANDTGQVNPQLVSNTSANLWVYGLLSTSP